MPDFYGTWAEDLTWGDPLAGFAVMLGLAVFLLVAVWTLKVCRWVYQLFGLGL